ncbi:unnamed protein product [Nyctereutes procyonoides]|uniref:(raccoon dog) hypothetical protein n=1 Tax=Nyctereutes procyonoides TaxID=34880 RepID=A0A811YWZ9_NYCPR|nr:unnamed protein product [Nyctereutes procyonoides]
MLRPRAGGRGSGDGGDPAGSARRRPRSRLPHVSLRPGPPPYTSGVPRPAARDETEAPARPRRLRSAEQLTSTPPWVTAARSDDAGREEEVGAPRAGGCASGRGTCRRRRRRLCGRVRTEERKGRSRGEPKLPPDLTPDPAAGGGGGRRAAGRARAAAVSSGARRRLLLWERGGRPGPRGHARARTPRSFGELILVVRI